MVTHHHFTPVDTLTLHRLVFTTWGGCRRPGLRGSFSNDSLSRDTMSSKDSSFLSPLPPSDTLSDAFVSTSQTACFFMPSSFLSPPSSHRSHLSSSSSSVWHQRAGKLEGVVVWRGQLTPPTPLQRMCIVAKRNGKPCECHQYVARGDVVTLQNTRSVSLCPS